MTRPADANIPAGVDISGLLLAEKQSVLTPEENARNLQDEAIWEASSQRTELRNSLESMAEMIRSEVLSSDHEEDLQEQKSRYGDNQNQDCPALIPGLPVDLATKILSRVPWKDQPNLMTVCKAWAACTLSNSIYSIRLKEGVLENFLFTLSVPIRLGPLRLTVFDFKVGTIEYEKPIVSFSLLGRWSGFLRGFRCAVIGPDLFIIGGRHDGLHYATGKNVWRFNFVSRKWREAASMHHARRDFACAVINNRVYVAGGTCNSCIVPQGQGVATAIGSAEMYDSERDEWHLLPSLHRARVGCLGVAHQNRFYVIGGGSDHGTVRFDMFRSAEVLDIHTCQWEFIDDMWRSGVQLPRAVAGYDSSLFAIDVEDQKLKSYDEASNVWTDVMNMPFSAINGLPGKMRSGVAERQQAMGGLPGDHLIQVPHEGLLWVGPCGFLSRAASLLKLEGREGRGWMGTVGTESCPEERAVALEKKIKKNPNAHLIIAAGAISI